jgi:hypothetical protein
MWHGALSKFNPSEHGIWSRTLDGCSCSMGPPYDGSVVSGQLPPWGRRIAWVLGLHGVRLPWVRPHARTAWKLAPVEGPHDAPTRYARISVSKFNRESEARRVRLLPWGMPLPWGLGQRLPWVRPRVEKATPSAQDAPECARTWETTTPVPLVHSTLCSCHPARS